MWDVITIHAMRMWLLVHAMWMWLLIQPCGCDYLSMPCGCDYLSMPCGCDYLSMPCGCDYLSMPCGCDYLSMSWGMWLLIHAMGIWLLIHAMWMWLLIHVMWMWLLTHAIKLNVGKRGWWWICYPDGLLSDGFITLRPGAPLLTWISNYTHYKVWDEIIYPFPNFNDATTGVWEWISNFIPCFTGHGINCPCWE